MNKTIKNIIAIIAGILLLLFVSKSCINSRDENAGPDKITIDTIYKIKTDTISITDYKPRVIYKNKYHYHSDTIEVINDSIKNWEYTIDTTYTHKNGTTNLKQKGWGYVRQIDINTTLKDSTIIINKETIKYKTSKGVYLSGEYTTPFNRNNSLNPTYGIKLDYVTGKWIIGTGVGYNTEPNYSIKVGYKIN